MAATYTEVSLEAIHKLLKRAFRVVLSPTQEIVRGEICFVLEIGTFVGIRVMTSVHRGRDTGAGRGQDAIRVGLISLKDRGPLEGGKMAIVKRTQNWADSLKDRIEDCIEKYEDKDEFWEQWAETRKRVDTRAKPEPERVQDPGRDGEGDGPDERPPLAPAPVLKPPVPTRQYDPDRMQGGITPPQMNYLRVLMRGMTQERWESAGAPAITGLSNYPRTPRDLNTVSKGQASKLIDQLKKQLPAAGSRYASGFELEDEDILPYDQRH
jgi:hypothetical protein